MEKEKLINVLKNDNRKSDEREILYIRKASQWSSIAMLCIGLIIILLRLSVGQDFADDILMIMMGELVFHTLYLYTKFRDNKKYLYVGLFYLVIFILFAYRTLAHYGII